MICLVRLELTGYTYNNFLSYFLFELLKLFILSFYRQSIYIIGYIFTMEPKIYH